MKLFDSIGGEFQAGTRKTRARKSLRAAQQKKPPKWMALRARRLPEKKPKREVKLKRDDTKLRRPLPKVGPKKLKIIKRERAIFNTREPEEEKRFEAKDSGLNEAIEGPQERVTRIQTPAVKKKVRKNRQFYETTLSKKRQHLRSARIRFC